jgi:hypothetical protein
MGVSGRGYHQASFAARPLELALDSRVDCRRALAIGIGQAKRKVNNLSV